MATTLDPRIGTQLAGYRLESVLGRGGMGVVYLAEDTRLRRKVAVKLVSPELAANVRFRERFLREAELAVSVDHPNVVAIYEAGESEGLLFIAMRFVEGGDVAGLLAREGRLEPERALAIVRQLAEALDTARFSRGLVHGSLKPSEVLVAKAADDDSGERVLLLGFGLRQELPPGATLAEALQTFGTIDYLAPEQIEGKSVSARSDVYALGCVLFECLTGEPPFKGDSADALLNAHLHEQPPSATQYRPGVPAGIDQVIRKAMAKSPEERYSTCQELAASAQAALEPGAQQPRRARREERLSPVAFPPRRERAVREETPPAQPPDGGPVVAPDSLAERLRKGRWKSVAAVGLVVLLFALVAGVIWLAGRDIGDGSSATPAPPEAETPGEVAVEEGAGSAEPPAEGGAAGESPVISAGGSLVRLDAATGEVVAAVALDGTPEGVVADGREVWVVMDRSTLVRIDPLSNDVGATFDLPDGEQVWALDAAGGDVWLTTERFEIMRLAAGADAFEPVDLPGTSEGPPVLAGGSLWVTVGAPAPGHLLRLNPRTGRVLARLEHVLTTEIAGDDFLWALGKGGWVRVDTDTNEITALTPPPEFLAGQGMEATFGSAVGEGSLWLPNAAPEATLRLNPVTGEEQARILGHGPIAAGGGAVWTGYWNDRFVSRYDLTSGEVRTIDVGGTQRGLAITGDSVWVAAVRDKTQESVEGLTPLPSVPEVDYVIDLNTGVMTPLPEAIIQSVAKPRENSLLPPRSPLYAASPDRSLLAYVGTGDEDTPQIFIAGIDGTGVRQVTHDPTGATSPAWSPDGTLIAYQGTGDGDIRSIFVLDVATGESTQITAEAVENLGQQFTPDGSSILYTSGSDIFPTLRTVPVAGGKSTLAVGPGEGVTDAGNGSLSPDGSLVTFLGSGTPKSGNPSHCGPCRFVANADGTDRRVIPGWVSHPAATWSPDGTRIVCSFDHHNIIVVDIATGDASHVAKGNGAIWLAPHTLLVDAA